MAVIRYDFMSYNANQLRFTLIQIMSKASIKVGLGGKVYFKDM